MMKEFTVGAAHTINLGHYESMRVEASVTFSVPEDEETGPGQLDTIRRSAQIELRSLLEETYKAQKRERKQRDEHSGDDK
jgi:hypothetical protein